MKIALRSGFPPTATCVIESAHLSRPPRRPRKIVLICCGHQQSRQRESRAAVPKLKRRACVHVGVRFPHVTDVGQPLTAVETHPYRRVFSKSISSKLQITFAALVMWHHLAAGTLALLLLSPLKEPRRRKLVSASCCPSRWQTGEGGKATPIDVCSRRALSFAPSPWLRFPRGAAAICCARRLARCWRLHLAPALINNSVYLCLCSDREPKDWIRSIDFSRYMHTATHKRGGGRALQNN